MLSFLCGWGGRGGSVNISSLDPFMLSFLVAGCRFFPQQNIQPLLLRVSSTPILNECMCHLRFNCCGPNECGEPNKLAAWLKELLIRETPKKKGASTFSFELELEPCCFDFNSSTVICGQKEEPNTLLVVFPKSSAEVFVLSRATQIPILLLLLSLYLKFVRPHTEVFGKRYEDRSTRSHFYSSSTVVLCCLQALWKTNQKRGESRSELYNKKI